MQKRFRFRFPTFKSCRSKDDSSSSFPIPSTSRHRFHHHSHHNHHHVSNSSSSAAGATTARPHPHLSRSKSTPKPKPHHLPHSTSAKNNNHPISLRPHGALHRTKSSSFFDDFHRSASSKNHQHLPPRPHGALHRTKSSSSSSSFSVADFHWHKSDRWLVITKFPDDDVPPPPLSPSPRRKIASFDSNLGDGGERSRRRKPTLRLRLSTSSTESSSGGIFGSTRTTATADEESESSSFESILLAPKKTKSGVLIRLSTSSVTSSAEEQELCRESVPAVPVPVVAARLSVFKRLIPCAALEGNVRESLAVVKKSDDPYEDFRRSMMEMVLEKQMFEIKDLERLLQILLALNERRHHGVIVKAFEEIQEALFCSGGGDGSCDSLDVI